MFTRAGLAMIGAAAVIVTAPASHAATVLTLEGGFVGMQHILHFTPTQLRGDLCKAPNHCQPVDYFAFPGSVFTAQGATNVEKAIDALPDDEPVVLFGHSEGGQVIYTDLRRWAANPETAPDPARVSWVSIGNPENPYGGRRPKTESASAPWLPPTTAYQGTEVIRQYDGWADWPDDPTNLLAVANAVAGMLTIHSNYRQVDLADPANVRYTPDVAGQPGNVTYVWVPTKTLPLVAWAGPLAPALDDALRPIVEKGYHRPVGIPDPSAAPTSAARTAAARLPTRSVAASHRSPVTKPTAAAGKAGPAVGSVDTHRKARSAR